MNLAPMSSPTSSQTPKTQHWRTFVVAALILVSMLLITQWSRVQSHESRILSASAEARAVAEQMADRTAHLLHRVEQAGNLATMAAQMPAATDLLIDGSKHSVVIVLDADGIVVDSTALARGTDLSHSTLFALARKATDTQVVLADPMRFGPAMAPVVPVIRALRAADGKFTGALVIAPHMAYFTETQQLPRHPAAFFAVVDSAGQMLAGSVDRASTPLMRISAATWAMLRRPTSLNTALPVMAGPVGAQDRLTAVAPVGAYGLSTVVGIPVESATADSRALFEVVDIVVVLLGLGVLIVSVLIHRQTERLHAALGTRSDAETALRDEKDFFDITLGSINDGVITIDQHQRVTFINRRAEMMTGCRAEEAVGRPVGDVVTLTAPADSDDFPAGARVPTLQERSQGVADLISAKGEHATVEYLATPLAARPTHSVLVLHDVSHATIMANRMAYQANHDPLTGLFNRSAFDAKLDVVLETIDTDESSHVVLFLDLDQFKVVNDSCGHAAGDELLKQVAFLFSKVLRPRDVLARTGGDEFSVLLKECPARVAMAVADKLRAQLSTFRFVWQEKNFQVGVSIGAVAVSAGCGSRDEIMRKADTACYIAKDTGRNRAHMYLDSDTAVMVRQGELSWAARLQKALAHGDFELQGQRIMSLDGGDGHYFEMLVRLVEPDGRLVPPMAFLPAAERYGLMPALDRAVIERALSMHGQLQAASTQPVKFAINLSGASLSDPQLLEFIEQALARHQVPAGLLCFEVTETMAIANLPLAVAMMTGLKALGCRLALDDFGSGMSSFSYLKQMPVDVVKIDGSFVRHMLENSVDRAMVEAVNNIAHQMGLRTLAEYAETPELIDALATMGVDMLQGYGVDKPQSMPHMLLSVRKPFADAA